MTGAGKKAGVLDLARIAYAFLLLEIVQLGIWRRQLSYVDAQNLTHGVVAIRIMGALYAGILAAAAFAAWGVFVGRLPKAWLRATAILVAYGWLAVSVVDLVVYAFTRSFLTNSIASDIWAALRLIGPRYWSILLAALAGYVALVCGLWRCRLLGQDGLRLGRTMHWWSLTIVGAIVGVLTIAVSCSPSMLPEVLPAGHVTTAHWPLAFLCYPTSSIRAAAIVSRVADVPLTLPLVPRSTVDQYLSSLGSVGVLGRPNVIMVMLDSVPAMHVGCYGYRRPTTPGIDRLARDGVVFETCYAAATESRHGQTSLFSSTLPMRGSHDYIGGEPFPRTLIWEVLGAAGYHTAYISAQDDAWGGISAFYLAGKKPADVHITARDISEGPLFLWNCRDEAVANRKAFHFIDDSVRNKRPFFLGMVYHRSHLPAELPPGHDLIFRPIVKMATFRRWSQDDIEENKAQNYYDNGLNYADECFDNLVRYLDQAGVRDNTIVAVTSDHGEGFEAGVAPHGESLKDPYVHVPWVIRYPPLIRPCTFSAPVSTVDVCPTLLGLTGLPPCPAWEGIDVLRSGELQCRQRDLYTANISLRNQWLVTRGDEKVMVDLADNQVWDYSTFQRVSDAVLSDANIRSIVERFVRVLGTHVRYYQTPAYWHDYLYPIAGTTGERRSLPSSGYLNSQAGRKPAKAARIGGAN